MDHRLLLDKHIYTTSRNKRHRKHLYVCCCELSLFHGRWLLSTCSNHYNNENIPIIYHREQNQCNECSPDTNVLLCVILSVRGTARNFTLFRFDCLFWCDIFLLIHTGKYNKILFRSKLKTCNQY